MFVADTFCCVRSGLTIRGSIFGKSCERKPAVILSHGFLSSEEECFNYAQILASIGYVCFTFDFNGGSPLSKSDGKSEDMTVFTEVDDLTAVLRFVQKQTYVDSKNITLLGCSQGGLVSALTARTYPSEISHLILIYPAFCIPDDARAGKMQYYVFDPKNLPESLGEYPMKLGKGYALSVMSMDIEKEIEGYSGPVLYLHGTSDSIVNISYARALHRVYPNCEYHEIQGGEHGFSGEAEKQADEYIMAFMKQ